MPHDPNDILIKFMRTCQECGHVQQDTEPTQAVKRDERRFNAWLGKACKKCRSEALDYGSNRQYSFKTGKKIPYEEVDDGEEL